MGFKSGFGGFSQGEKSGFGQWRECFGLLWVHSEEEEKRLCL